ncbi:MAG TPA: DUF4407 domain-containing protein [Pseudonocardiaceae bacterium]|nr:DUF4407 domain-containing protein [Pseudonocardiaceae bacterium]
MRPSDALTWLGGADFAILRQAPSGRSHFVQMGLVVLATSSIAVLSMAFALHNGLFLPTVLAMFGGIVWGCIIAVIDRFLITSLSLNGGAGRVAMIIGIRLAIAFLLGFVISTPIVLHVFQREIQAQIVETNATNDKAFGTDLNKTPFAAELATTRQRIDADEATLQGHFTPAVTPAVQTRQQALTQAQTRLAQLQAVSDQKYAAWQCELYGSSCEGSTDRTGNGTLAKARHGEYLTALAATNAAQRAVNTAQGQLTAAQNSSVAQNGAGLKTAQAAARAELPGLRTRAATLQQQYNKALDDGDQKTEDDTGLLAQIVALGQLGQQNSAAFLAHLAVLGLFFMIELLPVLVKLLSTLGPKSVYETVRELVENADVEAARIANRKRMAEDKKRDAIEEDMRTRERDLGFRANEHVAKEMEKVLDVALGQWAQQVHNALQTQPANGMGRNYKAPPPTSRNVRNNFNLPPGQQLNGVKP